MKEDAEGKTPRTTSRKWLVTVWATVMATAVILSCAVATFLGKEIESGFLAIGTTLCAVPIAYIGGNVLQKNIYAKGGGER